MLAHHYDTMTGNRKRVRTSRRKGSNFDFNKSSQDESEENIDSPLNVRVKRNRNQLSARR